MNTISKIQWKRKGKKIIVDEISCRVYRWALRCPRTHTHTSTHTHPHTHTHTYTHTHIHKHSHTYTHTNLLAANTNTLLILKSAALHEQAKFKNRSISPSFTTITVKSSPFFIPFWSNLSFNWLSIPSSPK